MGIDPINIIHITLKPVIIQKFKQLAILPHIQYQCMETKSQNQPNLLTCGLQFWIHVLGFSMLKVHLWLCKSMQVWVILKHSTGIHNHLMTYYLQIWHIYPIYTWIEMMVLYLDLPVKVSSHSNLIGQITIQLIKLKFPNGIKKKKCQMNLKLISWLASIQMELQTCNSNNKSFYEQYTLVTVLSTLWQIIIFQCELFNG